MGVSELAVAPGAKGRVTGGDPPRYAFVDLMRLVLGEVSQSHASTVITRAKKKARPGRWEEPILYREGTCTHGLHDGGR